MTASAEDVAAEAGVSPSTVSRCFASPEQVRPDTRERVLAAAARLGYTPSRVARSLALGRTRTLGLIVPDIANPFFAVVAKAVQARARRKDYAVFLADTDEDPDDEYELALTLARQVDGLLLVAPRMDTERLDEIIQQVPSVIANRRVPGVPTVVMPTADGLRQAVAHLHALGHRHLALVLGARDSWSSEQRGHAVREACEELGLKISEFGPHEPKFHTGAQVADLALASGATAVVAHNDLLALGILSRLSERGVRVPQDLSLVGVDDILLAATSTPALTSVRLPLDALGEQSVNLLLRRIEGGGPQSADPQQVVLDSELIVRRSTGPAPRKEP
ncbi:LacI family transcriptional regulator [Streptomyces sp. NBC_01280]|uniref:LacI family DNA-binding transcriptional regulator n=1 Tax=unclassified Streptomyces TaxID=2593676 RepID=UPI002E35596D|nr:LacI family DNA-binding transcriptional regulator [Streptomyces sp. NBC_01280]WSE11959.1 LacI family transcriptional regulator [Streptomyces sp. NBC_01397]WSE19667.1 LacI family transcriptional regulator [Streptomyces sp. NBC_01397]